MKYGSRAMCNFFQIWIWTSNRIDLISSVFLKYLQLCHCNFQKKKLFHLRAGSMRGNHVRRTSRVCWQRVLGTAHHHMAHPDRASARFKKCVWAICSRMHALCLLSLISPPFELWFWISQRRWKALDELFTLMWKPNSKIILVLV